MQVTGIAADDAVLLHNTGRGHPERPERYSAILRELDSAGLLDKCKRLASHIASDAELALVHRQEYIALVAQEVRQGRTELSTGDTTIGAGSLEAARAAAGSVIAAVDAVFERNVSNAFGVVRPPGHHASAARGMGFCLFNNIAIGAKRAQNKFGAERVLIVDWDVHHGNGTQDVFYRDGSVLFFSTHQYPWYPGTGAVSERGEGAGLGCTLNAPLPAGSGRKEVFEVFTGLLRPAAERFRPDVILISAGFDSRIGDPLGEFLLTDVDFAELTTMMLDLAFRFCEGRLVSVLEGGYDLTGLAEASAAHVRALVGQAAAK